MEELVEQSKQLLVVKLKLIEKLRFVSELFKGSVCAQCRDNQFLVEGLIQERKKAIMQQNKNLVCSLGKAIKSFQKYPLPLLHPKQALDLQGVGNSVCKMLYSFFKANNTRLKPLGRVEKPFHSSSLVLLIDSREQLSDSFFKALKGINYEVRKLSLGDFLWVVKKEGQEYLLDCVIERKTSSDLLNSQFSLHLHDQVRRLKASSFSTPTLLVEGKANLTLVAELQSQLRVVKLASQKHSASFLCGLWNTYQGNLASLECKFSFQEFQKRYKKLSTVGEVFQQILRNLPGMSYKKVTNLASVYPTFSHLRKEMTQNPQLTKKNLEHFLVPKATQDLLFLNLTSFT